MSHTEKSGNDWVTAGALLVAMFLWSSSFIAMKVALRAYHPMTMTFLRMVVASICFAMLIPYFRQRVHYRKGDWRFFLLMAVAEPCLYFIFESYALSYTSSSQAGMIVATLPFMVAVGARFILKEEFGLFMRLGFGLAVAGVVWLTMGAEAQEAAPNPFVGNMLELGAMGCAMIYTLCVRKLCAGYSPLFITAVQAWVGLIFFAPAMVIPGMGLPEEFSLWPTLGVLYMGCFVTLGAYGLYNFGVSRTTAGRATAYNNLIPVMTVLMGVFWLDERLTAAQYCACGLVLGGVLLSQKKSRALADLAGGTAHEHPPQV